MPTPVNTAGRVVVVGPLLVTTGSVVVLFSVSRVHAPTSSNATTNTTSTVRDILAVTIKQPEGSVCSRDHLAEWSNHVQTYAPSVLSTRILPRRAAITVALVVGFALLTAAASQVKVPLPFTPVPVTGQTFVVLLAGATLGSRAGAASQMLYILLGIAGLPFFAGGSSGWEYATGGTFGYLIGFVVAAAVVGYLAEQKRDRTVATALPAFLAGTALIYLLGVSWLMVALQVDFFDAVTKGLLPFLAGDALKIILAGTLLPAAWRLIGKTH
jgi:biotin transport system substrate-specific component